VEGYKLKGIIPKWGELSRDIEDGDSFLIPMNLMIGKIQCFFHKFLESPYRIAGG
jgi:hypothetical protein